MRIFVISDLHLSFDKNKPMDIFGSQWVNYEETIRKNWLDKVKEEDVVIIPGDLSWGTYLEDSIKDFEFIDKLPGKKILLKGNHDYWWETVSKMNKFFEEHGISSIKFLYNNFYETPKYLICGTKYWSHDDESDNKKIFNREIERAKISIKKAREANAEKPILFVTHYPPDERIVEELIGNNIALWIYGHVHSNYEEAQAEVPAVNAILTSCDYTKFDLVEIV